MTVRSTTHFRLLFRERKGGFSLFLFADLSFYEIMSVFSSDTVVYL